MFLSLHITYRSLTDPSGMLEPDGERGHTYTDDLIRRAVMRGIDGEGRPLAWPMPRWRLDDRRWADLLAYLRTLPRRTSAMGWGLEYSRPHVAWPRGATWEV